MPYGGLIIIITYATQGSHVDEEVFLITQSGEPILTSVGQTIIVQ